MKLIPWIVGTLLLSSWGLSQAQTNMPGMDHSTMPPSSEAKPNAPILATLEGKAFDRAFLSMMIPHHEMALQMAQMVMTSKDAKVNLWAKNIMSAQQKEISQMKLMLGTMGGIDKGLAASTLLQMSNGIRKTSTPDQEFVEQMIPHHSSAIDMANLALQKSSNPSVLKLAKEIVQAQAGEIYEFKIWLIQKGAKK
jgi:uncharacterized protein (DUF305 family)